MKIRIMVAAHKPYWMPVDEIYMPIFVGATGKQTIVGYMRDDQGENISQKNDIYCELTGLYQVWKNTDADIYGLCHYRRYLADQKFLRPKKDRILKEDQILSLLLSADIILPKKKTLLDRDPGRPVRACTSHRRSAGDGKGASGEISCLYVCLEAYACFEERAYLQYVYYAEGIAGRILYLAF